MTIQVAKHINIVIETNHTQSVLVLSVDIYEQLRTIFRHNNPNHNIYFEIIT